MVFDLVGDTAVGIVFYYLVALLFGCALFMMKWSLYEMGRFCDSVYSVQCRPFKVK